MCKFVSNNQHCPYDEIGCKFSHEHELTAHEPSTIGNIDDNLDNDDEESNDSYEFIENQCHLCKLQLLNRDDLYNHVETDHQ